MSNGRSFDPEIAKVIIDAVYDGAFTYDAIVQVIHAQAKPRTDALKRKGTTAAEIKKERARWANFNKGSITKWKRVDPEFERDLMDAQDRVALEETASIADLGDLAMAIATNEGREGEDLLSPEERRVRLEGLKHKLNAEKWRIEMRLAVRKTYHETNMAAGVGRSLPAMPYNPRFDELPPAGGSDVN